MSDRSFFPVALLVLLGIAFALGVAYISASQEARAYNRLTGGEATTWDALWVELRVDGDR